MKWRVFVILIIFLTGYFIGKGDVNISYHKREDEKTIMFISFFNSCLIIEHSKKRGKGSLDWVNK